MLFSCRTSRRPCGPRRFSSRLWQWTTRSASSSRSVRPASVQCFWFPWIPHESTNVADVSVCAGEIGQLCRKRKVFFHTDAAQAFGKIPMDVNRLNIDLMSISGHKIYGPKGAVCYFLIYKRSLRLLFSKWFYNVRCLYLYSWSTHRFR